MSRIANNPVSIPAGVEVTLNDTSLSVKGSKGTMALDVQPLGVDQSGRRCFKVCCHAALKSVWRTGLEPSEL